jgi:ABC-type multidrug transport system ATPase subunit
MGNVSFTNPDSKKTFTLNLDANMIFIYGGNGSGKTTLSRGFDSEHFLVFNTDFINQNVYIVKSSGADIDSETKENFTSLFLGEEAVQLAKEVELATIGKKENDKILSKEFSEFKDKILKEGLIPFSKIEEIASDITYELNFDPKLNLELNKKNFKITRLLETSITNNTQYQNQLKIYKEDNTINDLNKKIAKDQVLSKLIVHKKDVIDIECIKQYNLSTVELKNLETSFNKGNSPKDTQDWIKCGIKLHEIESDCIFCGNENIQDKIDDWKKKLENSLIKQKTDLLKQLTEIKTSIEIILKDKQLYREIVPKILKTTNSLMNILDEYIEKINSSQIVEIKEYNIEVDAIQQDKTEMQIDLRNYFSNKIVKDVIFIFAYSTDYFKHLEIQIKRSEELNLVYATETAKNINDISKFLGFSKDIIINLERRGNMPKIALQSADRDTKISSYSEGQRHKLALAVFFTKFLKIDKEIEALVLDDPVITLDVKSYHTLKCMLREDRFHKAKRIIITTHNIHYLYVQMSNILESEHLQKITKLYELTSESLNEVPVYILKADDLSIYTKYIEGITTYHQLDKIYWLTSKIARYFLDLRLRFRGLMSIQNMSLEIPLLDVSDNDKSRLQQHFNSLSSICSKPNIIVEEAITSFENLNSIVKILGFPEVISKQNIDKFIPNKKDQIKLSDNSKDIIEQILIFGRIIHFNDGTNKVLKEMKNYIDHPRNQITESILVLKASQDI